MLDSLFFIHIYTQYLLFDPCPYFFDLTIDPPLISNRFAIDSRRNNVPAGPYNFQQMNMESPNEKKRYLRSTASLYASIILSYPPKAETSMSSVLLGKW